MLVVGVDGRRTGWIAVALTNGLFAGASRFPSIRALLSSIPDADTIGVDLPTGGLNPHGRECDQLAEELIDPMVLGAPPTPVLASVSFEEARQLHQELTGSELSAEQYALRHKVLELRAAITEQDAAPDSEPASGKQQKVLGKLNTRKGMRKYARVIQRDGLEPARHASRLVAGRIIEFQPEASFRELAGRRLTQTRDTAKGVAQRLDLLQRGGVRLPMAEECVGGVPIEDAIDAAAGAWSAHRYGLGLARCHPGPERWQYDGDRLLAFWT